MELLEREQSGEAGIGKTSLVERFAEAHKKQARLLWGACDALFTPRPLGPLYDIAHQTQGNLLSYFKKELRARLSFLPFSMSYKTARAGNRYPGP